MTVYEMPPSSTFTATLTGATVRSRAIAACTSLTHLPNRVTVALAFLVFLRASKLTVASRSTSRLNVLITVLLLTQVKQTQRVVVVSNDLNYTASRMKINVSSKLT